jgi:hypothetical protein
MSTGPCLPSFLAGGRLDGVAAERGTSVSGLVARELEQLVARNARYEEAMRRAIELMEESEPHGGRTWRRDELYEDEGPWSTLR